VFPFRTYWLRKFAGDVCEDGDQRPLLLPVDDN
jgi:hypothetical protein